MWGLNQPRSVLDILPCVLPSEHIPEHVDQTTCGIDLTEKFAYSSLKDEDFVSHAMWRDSFALTGSLRTFYSAGAVIKTWTQLTGARNAANFQFLHHLASVRRTTYEICWIELPFIFEVTNPPQASCSGS